MSLAFSLCLLTVFLLAGIGALSFNMARTRHDESDHTVPTSDPLQSITIMRRTLRIEESGHSVDDHFIFELHVQDGGNHAPQP